jgi:hypothetical protein
LVAIWTLNIWFGDYVWIYVDLSFEFLIHGLCLGLVFICYWVEFDWWIICFLSWYLVWFKTHYCVLFNMALVKFSNVRKTILQLILGSLYCFTLTYLVFRIVTYTRDVFLVLNKLIPFCSNNNNNKIFLSKIQFLF